MGREDMIKLVIIALAFPVVFILLAYFNEGGVLSIMHFFFYLLLSVVGGLIGAVYSYYGHKLFLRNSFLAGFIPSMVLIFISTGVGMDKLMVLGDLCLILSCWLIASEVATIKNKAA